jgi:uncharacterized surface protein with fasciclin (FAS1) repeats
MATVLELSQADKNLVSFMKAIKASGMEDELKAVGPFTFLAPVNLAFGKLSQGDLFETLLKQDGSRLRTILSYHIIKGKKMQRDFRTGNSRSPPATGIFILIMPGYWRKTVRVPMVLFIVLTASTCPLN